jgi:hypothetical protein
MDNAIGFRRNLYLDWMDAAAAFAAAGDDAATLRTRLDPIVAHVVESEENRRYALTILGNIWGANQQYPDLYATALGFYAVAASVTDRLWLHYGMTILAYPFFHQTARVIGQQVQRQDAFTGNEIKQAMIANRGHLGGLVNAVERVVFSLRNWGLLTNGPTRNTYAPVAPRLTTTSLDLQTWLLAVTLTAHSGEELPYIDLIRLPEHFPFAFTLSLDHLRHHPWFAVQRQGATLDMVRLV